MSEEDSLDVMTWEERFWVAYNAVVKLEARAERAERERDLKVSDVVKFESTCYIRNKEMPPELKTRLDKEYGKFWRNGGHLRG